MAGGRQPIRCCRGHQAEAGAELRLTANWTLTAKFDGEFASGSQTCAGTGTLRYA
jgi:hypothetical protein